MNKGLRIVALLLAMAMVVPAPAAAKPVKHRNDDGSVPSQWNLPKPARQAHDDVTPASAGGDGDGYNNISFSGFDNGDIIVVLGTLTGHAGSWDDSMWNGSISSRSVVSANKTPITGVQREAASKYRTYDYAYGLWVPSVSATYRTRARDYTLRQLGEPYVITSSKGDQTQWYCSKLCWSSYRYTSGLDLDADGGYYVWPVDLVNDSQTSVFAAGD